MAETDNEIVKMDNENISLADLAGLNMDDIAEKRGGEPFPKGVFQWEVSNEEPPKLQKLGEGDKAKAGVIFHCKCIDVVAVTDPDFKDANDSLIGKVHNEIFRIGNLDGLGYLKAFIKDIGAPYSSNFADLLSGCAGVRFEAPIGKKKDPNDSDVVYTNLVRGKKMKPLAAATVSEVAAAVA